MRAKVAITFFLALILWLPRGLDLDHFVAVDERSWLTRSGNFYLALTQQDYANTFQRYHPGVTTMWLGMVGYLWDYPDYPADAQQVGDMSAGVEGFLRTQGHEPLTLLAASRSAVVVATILLLLYTFWLAVDLLGLLTALTGFLLIAFEPFLLGLTRMLHVDGLSSTLMFVSLLAFLHYQHKPDHRRHLLFSAIAAGLAWLTKSPTLFLLPFVGLLTLGAMVGRWRKTPQLSALRGPLVDLLIWGGVAGIVFVALWPSMWVDPVGSLHQIINAAGESATAGHSSALFFNGMAYTGDPGPLFYPLTYLWRTTSVVLLGLLLAMGAFFLSPKTNEYVQQRRILLMLLLYVLLFTLLMTAGSKKFPRYLLPVYLPLNLIAGYGWASLAIGLSRYVTRPRLATMTYAGLLAVPIVLQMAFALPHFPYYFTYYNPLFGDTRQASNVMMLGLGEGLDEAARYLLAKPNAEELTVASWYRGGSFNYIFPYTSLDIEDFYQADYAVIYAHQWQRQVPDRRLLDYFARLTPEHIVTLGGMEYAAIYDLHNAPPPDYFVDWAAAIRLVQTDVPETPVEPEEPFVVRLHFYTVAPLDRNLNVIVRLVDDAGNEVARSEGWPFGTPTSTWETGQVYVDGYEFVLPDGGDVDGSLPVYYRVEVSLYDPESQRLLTPTVAGTDTPLPELLPVDYVVHLAAGAQPVAPTTLFQPDVILGETYRLLGTDFSVQEMKIDAGPGDTVEMTLYWQRQQPDRVYGQPASYTTVDASADIVPGVANNAVDYTVLLHLLGPDGTVAAQWDRQPLYGHIPTSMWHLEETIVDPYLLDLPEALPPGDYTLHTGLYDLVTLERLPVTRDGEATGDTVQVLQLHISPSGDSGL